MANHNGNGSTGALLRPTYFDRQQLQAADLNAGMGYVRERLRRHNRFLHGWGVVCGAQVNQANDDSIWTVAVAPGYAVTPGGDELYLEQATVFDIRPGVEACLGTPPDCDDEIPTSGETAAVRIVRASINPPGRDVRPEYNEEWIELCVLQPTSLAGFRIDHTLNPDTAREAFALYRRHLAPTGVLALHATNKYVDLVPVLRGAAEAVGLPAIVTRSGGEAGGATYSAIWVLVGRNDALHSVTGEPAYAARRVRLWTDDYSNLFQLLK